MQHHEAPRSGRLTDGSISDVKMLEGVLIKDAALLAAVRSEQLTASTPCPEWDVQALINHLLEWLPVFTAAATGRAFEADPSTSVSNDPATEFQAAAAELVAGWRINGVDRPVRLTGGELPGQKVLAMTLMEYLTHGCDLAAATGQAAPFSEEELTVTLERARATLPEQYRGDGRPFGPAIDVPEEAPIRERLLGFMGRRA